MLIIFGGLPATGKTTIAKALAKQLNATYLRADTIEHTLKLTKKLPEDMEDIGYRVAYAIATENLQLGNIVIADTVNPLTITRQAWCNAAEQANNPYLEVEIICSDQTIHQQRAENRSVDIDNFELPTWEAIVNRNYQPWATKTITIDTAKLTVQQAIKLILQALNK